MKILALKVDDKIAETYNAARASEKEKMETLINDLLKEIFIKKNVDEFLKLRNEIAKKASAKGLTQTKLGKLMKWDKTTMKNLFE